MTAPYIADDTTDFRLSGRALATALLAIIAKALLATPALFLIKVYTTAAMMTLTEADLPVTIHNLANIVFLLMVPNLASGFCCGWAGFRIATRVLRPTDWRMPALLASSVFIAWAIGSLLVSNAVHILVAVQLPGTVLGIMTLGVHRGSDRAWRFIEMMIAAIVLLAVVANLLVPRFMMHETFDPATGGINEKPMQPDARLPLFHRVPSAVPMAPLPPR